MKRYSKQSGLTLTELVVVIATMAILVVFGLPAVRALLGSFESQNGARSMIGAALASARAIAAKEQHYAGVRFQEDEAGDQYMIFIIHDYDKTGLNPGFRAIEGVKPIKLPDNSGVMDLMVRVASGATSSDAETTDEKPITAQYLDDTNAQNLGPDQKNRYVTDTTTFSIIFAPGGRLVVRDVRVRNKDGIYRPDNSIPDKISMDRIFNSPTNIQNNNVGLFVQDDYAELGLGAEFSRNKFVIYDKTQFDKLDAQGRYDYIKGLDMVYINPYTGTIINNLQ